MKFKMISVLLLSLTLISFGCTPSTQVIAQSAQERGMHQEHRVVMDLSTMAWQQALDATVADVRDAVVAGSEGDAQKAVEKFATKLDKIAWLEVQHERAQSLLRIGQRFIYEQKSIVRILYEEWKEAKAINESKGKVPLPAKEAKKSSTAEVVTYPCYRTLEVRRGEVVEYLRFVKEDVHSNWEELK